MTIHTSQISNILTSWYEQNKRVLPWRETKNPYKIWISEIILQQTRIIQGTSYYLRFIERFGTLEELAAAEEDEVLKYWQGLGYYSRARNLHKAATQISTNFGGVFPTNHADIIHLPGIGDYTAAAICSFAYNQPYAVVDGNVYRVLARVFGIETAIDSSLGKKEFAKLANDLLSLSDPGTHNQAIMEFGALQCIPSSPDCPICPLKNLCKAFELNLINLLPIKEKKTKVINRYFNYLFIQNNETTFLQKRTEKDIWQHLYEFPLIETDHLLSSAELLKNEFFHSLFNGIETVELMQTTNPMKHVLSHRVIYAQFTTIRIHEKNERFNTFTEISMNKIDTVAVSRLMELFLEELDS